MRVKSRTTAALDIVILAAGQGKRMQSALPKVLQPLAGRALLAHVIDVAQALTPEKILIVHGHGAERVRAQFADAALSWVLQAEQLGTGHALLQAMPDIADDNLVLVLYGDVPLIRAETLRALIATAGPKALSLLTALLQNPQGYGRVIRDRRGQVQRVVEQQAATRRELAVCEGNSGVLVAPARLLKKWLLRLKSTNAQGEYYLTDIIAMAVKDKIRVTPLLAATEAEVLGANDKLQLAQLEAEYRRLRAQELMQAGATVIDPARLDVRGEVTVGRDVVLDINVVLEGPVHLGDGVRIEPNCIVRDARIGAGTILHANCVVQRAEIGVDCEIGPFARIRPGTRLQREVHIGNFVELKNADIGAGSKANHLSYIGDATIGGKVNVGAGTVTCNYDGANKWRTEIGDNAFIGSGSMLVAPIKIGAGATIGAGSTITGDAPAAKLTLERSQQLTVENWQAPTKRRT